MKDKEFRMSAKTLILPLFLILLCCVFGCRNKHHTEKNETAHDLPQIKDSGELVVLTLYSSTSYFIYRGQEMGFQYELSEQFAKSLGLKLRIEVARNVRELIQKLQSGEGDMIAYNLPITKEWKDSLLYCGEDIITHQVIVQQGNGKHKPLKDVTELIGKDIYVKPGKYYDRLVNLNNELGGGIHIHKITGDSVTAEDLITQVAQGKIPYTVADNDLAKLNKTYYPNLNIDLSISFDQRSSWAVRKDSPELAAAATNWHKENMTSPAYTASMKRYFENSKMMPHSPILSLKEGKISHYDDLFKKYAQEIGWDWRMLASLAYTESNFDTTAVSWAGAKGLMQLMPATARAMGVPGEAILAGISEVEAARPGCHVDTPKKVFEEVINLCEWPTVLVGTFDEEFLKVPHEIICESMLTNQLYFPIYDGEGKLTREFVVVSNSKPENAERVIDGNERVVRARLDDAKFFYEEDLKISLDEFRERLSKVAFQEKLGSVLAKSERIEQLALAIAREAHLVHRHYYR